MDKNGWNVGEAKQQFSKVLRRSERVPQLIYRRNRLIAAVVSMEAKAAAAARPATIGERFEEARAILRGENYRLPQTRRRSRANPFMRTLNAVADRHKRS
jgi:hypothetical protein